MPLPYVLLLWEKEYLKPPNMHLYMIWKRHSMIYCSCASCDEKSLPIIPHPGSRWNRWPAPLYPWWPGCSLVMCLQRSGREKHGEARWHPWGQRSMTFLSVCHFKTKAQTWHTRWKAGCYNIGRCDFTPSVIIYYLTFFQEWQSCIHHLCILKHMACVSLQELNS